MTRYPDERMFQGIERFQSDHGLKKDGIVKPGGPTSTVLTAAAKQKEDADGKDQSKEDDGKFDLPDGTDDRVRKVLDEARKNEEKARREKAVKNRKRPSAQGTKTPSGGGVGGGPIRRGPYRPKQPWQVLQNYWELLN